MKSTRRISTIGISALLLALPARVLGANILQSNGFSECSTKSDITVQRLNIQFNKDKSVVTFDVEGTSNKVQEVTATLTVLAYGQQIYQKVGSVYRCGHPFVNLTFLGL